MRNGARAPSRETRPHVAVRSESRRHAARRIVWLRDPEMGQRVSKIGRFYPSSAKLRRLRPNLGRSEQSWALGLDAALANSLGRSQHAVQLSGPRGAAERNLWAKTCDRPSSLTRESSLRGWFLTLAGLRSAVRCMAVVGVWRWGSSVMPEVAAQGFGLNVSWCNRRAKSRSTC